MMSKRPKLADIAALAGVSKSTVSFVLNGHAKKHRIHAETVERVLAVAKAHNYAPSLYARALKSSRTYSVGLVIPDILNMGFATIAKRLEQLSREVGYQLLIVSSEDDADMEQTVIKHLLERQVDLLLVASAAQNADFLLDVNQHTPVITFDRVFEDSPLCRVKSDATAATKQVVAKLCHERSECVYIGGQLTLSTSQERFEGYRQGLISAGLDYQPQHVLIKDYQPQSGYELIEQAHQSMGRLPQTVFTASYSILEGVLRYLSEHKLLNADIRLATFDNYSILDCLPLAIDSIEQDCEQIALALFECGKQLLESDEPLELQRSLAAKIHYRDTR
ncbi:LacI family DNA-binding transcriptional regulator [Vibrio cholerae]